MAITSLSNEVEHVGKRVIERKAGAFSTTDTQGTLSTQLRMIKSASFSPMPGAALAAAECLFLVGTPNADGSLSISSGVVTVGRVGSSVTSALKFQLKLEGY